MTKSARRAINESSKVRNTTMTYRLVLDYNYPVKARRGERKGPKGSLLKAVQFIGTDLEDILADARNNTAAIADAATLISATLYDNDAFRAGNYNGEDMLARI